MLALLDRSAKYVPVRIIMTELPGFDRLPDTAPRTPGFAVLSGLSLLQLSQRAAAAIAAARTTPYTGSPCCFLSGTALLQQQQPRGGGNKLDPATAAAVSLCGGERRTVSPWLRRSPRGATTTAIIAAALLSSPRGTAAETPRGSGSPPRSGRWTGKRGWSYHAPSVALSGGAAAADVGGAAAATPTVVGGGAAVEGRLSPVIFVLGGPGSGKGTQCERLAKEYGYVHLSAGELLREERESGSSNGQLIDEYIRDGRIVPVAISLGLLKTAMEKCGPASRFLIDGFPRNADNLQGWDSLMREVADVRRVLFLDCPADVLRERLLSRGLSSGRTDDNLATANRRLDTFVETTLPVVDVFEREGMVARVDGNQDVRSVFQDVLLGLKPAHEKEVLDAHQMAAEAISTGDMEAYAEMCTSDMTEIIGEDLTAISTDTSTTATTTTTGSSKNSGTSKTSPSSGTPSPGGVPLPRSTVRMLNERLGWVGTEVEMKMRIGLAVGKSRQRGGRGWKRERRWGSAGGVRVMRVLAEIALGRSGVSLFMYEDLFADVYEGAGVGGG
eukprot:jgi/Undpi1/5653/HiC_scaffold_2.g00927.m1